MKFRIQVNPRRRGLPACAGIFAGPPLQQLDQRRDGDDCHDLKAANPGYKLIFHPLHLCLHLSVLLVRQTNALDYEKSKPHQEKSMATQARHSIP